MEAIKAITLEIGEQFKLSPTSRIYTVIDKTAKDITGMMQAPNRKGIIGTWMKTVIGTRTIYKTIEL